MRNSGLDEAQAGIKIAGRNINKLRYADDTTLMSERGTKKPIDESERREWKSWLKVQHSENEDHGIWSHHFMANRWETVETVSDFIFWGSKITADGDCSQEIKRCLLLGRKVMTNLDSIFKSRDITLPTKVCLSGLWFFQWSCMDVRVGLWRRLSTTELTLLNCGVGEDCWESLGLQGDPTSQSRETQSWIFMGGTDAEAEASIISPPDAKNWLIVKDPDAGKDWGQKEKGTTENEMVGWHHWLNGHRFG